jgi:hypothetical protein
MQRLGAGRTGRKYANLKLKSSTVYFGHLYKARLGCISPPEVVTYLCCNFKSYCSLVHGQFGLRGTMECMDRSYSHLAFQDCLLHIFSIVFYMSRYRSKSGSSYAKSVVHEYDVLYTPIHLRLAYLSGPLHGSVLRPSTRSSSHPYSDHSLDISYAMMSGLSLEHKK